MEQFYKKYKVINDTPEYKKGIILQWNFWKEMYQYPLFATSYDEGLWVKSGKNVLEYTKSFIESRPNWFKPFGCKSNFYNKFPKSVLDLEEHVWLGDFRHNNMCRFCQVARDIIETNEFKTGVYELLKSLYNKKIGVI